MGTYISGIIVIVCAVFLSKSMLGDFTYAAAIIAGLIVGIAIGKVTEASGAKHFMLKVTDKHRCWVLSMMRVANGRVTRE